MRRRSDFEVGLANSARVYDYMLGGKDYYACDERVAKLVDLEIPACMAARENREFMYRAVDFLARDESVRQYLDIGCGFPEEIIGDRTTDRNLHDIVHEILPRNGVDNSRIVYMDCDEMVLLYMRTKEGSYRGRGDVSVSEATDAADAAAVLWEATRLGIDFGEPVALCMFGVMEYIEPDAANKAIQDLVTALAPGSFLAMSCLTGDHSELVSAAVEVYRENGIDVWPRSKEMFQRYFSGLELVEPGIVSTHRWRPAGPRRWNLIPSDIQFSTYAAVGRLPG